MIASGCTWFPMEQDPVPYANQRPQHLAFFCNRHYIDISSQN